MICLTKLFQQKRRRIGYILAFSDPTISKRDSSEIVHYKLNQMELEPRSYGKSELAMLYFPKSDPKQAQKHLSRWIGNIEELRESLDACHIGKNAKHWSRKQVELIIYYLGEP